jgi:hypothetical protein
MKLHRGKHPVPLSLQLFSVPKGAKKQKKTSQEGYRVCDIEMISGRGSLTGKDAKDDATGLQ